ncbi:hypothetical protein ACP275_06G180800 [Erythranthe tilingii]
MATAAELKKELQRVVDALMEEDDDDDDFDNLEKAIEICLALQKNPPPEFNCPISGVLMKHPVVLASGQTYEEQIIQQWLKEGHQTCPLTNQLLPHTALIPNLSIKKMINNWCTLHRFEIPIHDDETEDYSANANAEHLIELLEKLSSSSSSTSDRADAAKELRLLTKRFSSFRALFGETKDAIPRLLSPILIQNAYSDSDLRNDLVAIVLNISTHESSKKRIVAGENCPLAISFLVESLRDENVKTRSNAAAAISSLSTLDSNKHSISKSGAITALIELIEEGHPFALRDASLAILNLCTVLENREIVVREGAVMAIVEKIIDCVLVDEMLEILAMLSSHERAIEEIGECGVIFCLFGVLGESVSEKSTENCVSIIYNLCFSDRRKVMEISEVENAYEILSRVAKSGTSRAKRKANGILERMNRFAFARLKQ